MSKDKTVKTYNVSKEFVTELESYASNNNLSASKAIEHLAKIGLQTEAEEAALKQAASIKEKDITEVVIPV